MKKINKDKFLEKKPTALGNTVNSKGQEITFYEHPTRGEDAEVMAIIGDVCFYTDFYEMDDFGTMSEYNPALLESGSLVCDFEA